MTCSHFQDVRDLDRDELLRLVQQQAEVIEKAKR
jgi:hypothetical protein